MTANSFVIRVHAAVVALMCTGTASAAPTDPFTHPAGLAGSEWVVIEVNGQSLDPVFSATLQFRTDAIWVDEQCPYFLAVPQKGGGMKLEFAETIVACEETTQQQTILENVFRDFRHFQFDQEGFFETRTLTIVSEDGHWITVAPAVVSVKKTR